MKKINDLQSYLTRLRGLMLTLIILCSIGIGNAWGAEDTSEFTSKEFEGLSNSWSKTSSGTLGYDATRGAQHQQSATTTFTA